MDSDPSKLLEIVEKLAEAEVRFVIIGGLAMSLHGSAHVTFDLDLTYSSNVQEQKRLCEVIRSLNPRLRGVNDQVPFILDERTLHNTQVITMGSDLGDIDLLARPLDGASFEDLWTRAAVAEVRGRPVRIASIDDLIAMKAATPRIKDKLHILELEAIKEERAKLGMKDGE